MSERPVALPVGLRTALVLGVATVAGLMMLCWPLLLQADPGQRVEPWPSSACSRRSTP